MTWIEIFLTPISLTFLVVILGCCLGKVRLFKTTIGVAAVLVMAMIGGYLLTVCQIDQNVVYITKLNAYTEMLSSFGTALFVSAIGIVAGYSIDMHGYKEWRVGAVGCAMVVASIMTICLLSIVDSDMSFSSFLGILCGALTTTPGLSAVCELPNTIKQEAVTGYGGAYFVGVIMTLSFVRWVTHRERLQQPCSVRSYSNEGKSHNTMIALTQMGISVVVGSFIGAIKMPVLGLAIGSTCGILCTGILVGCVVRRWFPLKQVSPQLVNAYKNLGIILFFVGMGIPTGLEFSNGVHIKVIVYACVVSGVALLCGHCLCKCFLKRQAGKSASIIAGGMTSTPAISAISEKEGLLSVSQYSYAYLCALLTIVIGVRLLGCFM